MKKLTQALLLMSLIFLAYLFFLPAIVDQKEAEFQDAGIESNLFQDFRQFTP